VNTKEMIIETSRELFNEHRSTNVSTKLIAVEMGISPGNLYYHFSNKEEIIRCIYDQLSIEMDAIFYNPAGGILEEGIAEFYKKLAWLQKHYRFFYLELSVLVRNDPILLETYQRRSERVMEQCGRTFDAWVELGIMKPFKSAEEREMLVLNSWTLGQLWITHGDILDEKIPQELIMQGIMRVHHLLRPYFTARTNKKLEAMLRKLK